MRVIKAIVAGCMLGWGGSAWAIVVTGGAPATAPTGDYAGLDWQYVYQFNGSSAVAIGPRRIITAGHVANDGQGGDAVPSPGDSFTLTRYDDGTASNVTFNMTVASASVPSPDIAATNGGRPDIAIIEFTTDLPYNGGHYALATGPLFVNQEAVLIGWGRGGSTGTNDYDAASTSLGSVGVKRWGTNELETIGRGEYTDNNGHAFSSLLLVTSFDNDPLDTPFEAGVGVNDSGGGLFVLENGEWRLAGVNVTALGPAGANTGAGSVDLTYAPYADWVNTTIPEPGTLSLALLGCGLLLRRRRHP